MGSPAGDCQEGLAKEISNYSYRFARLLDRRVAAQTVALRNRHGLSWRQIADSVDDDPEWPSMAPDLVT